MLGQLQRIVQDSSRPLASSLGLTELPEHAPLLLASALAFWTVQMAISPVLSSALFPKSYGRLRTKRDRNNWCVIQLGWPRLSS